MSKPLSKPARPFFSSGPTCKRPGWKLDVLSSALVGRSHRSQPAVEHIKQAIDLTRQTLKIPDDFRVSLVPGSGTGAIEMLLWNLLGKIGVDILSWDVFGKRWQNDIEKRLQISDSRVIEAPYGELPDLTYADCNRDLVFTWNGTSTGVCLPNGDWITNDRKGLTICDAVSAAFIDDLPWDKLDATAFSWQKALGGEAGVGVIVLSPLAQERLAEYKPAWPIPGLLSIHDSLFKGHTSNTISLLMLEDYLDALRWYQSIDVRARVTDNYNTVAKWMEQTPWIDFLCKDESTRSKSSVCLKIVSPTFANDEEHWAFIRKLCALIEGEGAGFDICGHVYSVPNLRIWCGPTVESDDIAKLLPWINWAYG